MESLQVILVSIEITQNCEKPDKNETTNSPVIQVILFCTKIY